MSIEYDIIINLIANMKSIDNYKKNIYKHIGQTEAAALVVIDRSTATGARVGSIVEVCVRQGSRSIVPPPF